VKSRAPGFGERFDLGWRSGLGPAGWDAGPAGGWGSDSARPAGTRAPLADGLGLGWRSGLGPAQATRWSRPVRRGEECIRICGYSVPDCALNIFCWIAAHFKRRPLILTVVVPLQMVITLLMYQPVIAM
jgi:hypothetical protein